MAAAEGVPLVDVYEAFGGDLTLISSDGLHPNAAGYQRTADAFFQKLSVDARIAASRSVRIADDLVQDRVRVAIVLLQIRREGLEPLEQFGFGARFVRVKVDQGVANAIPARSRSAASVGKSPSTSSRWVKSSGM